MLIMRLNKPSLTGEGAADVGALNPNDWRLA